MQNISPTPPPAESSSTKHKGTAVTLGGSLVILAALATILQFMGVTHFQDLFIQPTPNADATATALASTPSVTWLVTADGYENALALKNGYQVNDTVNHHFIVVHLTFTNNTSQAQELQTGKDIYLQGSDGQRYYEDRASNPSNVLQFAPGETRHIYTAYVVPDSVCNYTLVVANPDGQDLTRDITVTDSNYCHA